MSNYKGLMAFTEEDGELYRRLEREADLAGLNSYISQKTPLVVIMGESGAGKTSLLRAGLSHILKNTEIQYIYWESMPSSPAQSLPRTVSESLSIELTELSDLLTINKKAVIVLDQFEQLSPDNPEHDKIFDLLKQIALSKTSNRVTWFVAFRREYSATWRDFELDNNLMPPMISLKLFSIAQAKNVFTTLAEEGGLTLEQSLVDGFTAYVSRDNRLSPVDIGIGLLMLNELANIKQTQQLSLEDYRFAGRSEGLFVSFLNTKIEERFPDKKEQESLFKALLELIDIKRNQRIAEGRTLEQLAQKADNISAKLLEFALNYFASPQVRMLEKVTHHDKSITYRLPHESMIPALRQLASKALDQISQTNLNLQTAYYAWLNSNKDKRYLLTGKDLKAVRQFRDQCDLSDKSEFLKLSVRKKWAYRVIAIVLAIVVSVTSYFGYQSYVEFNYRNSLRDWGLPEDLRDYGEQLKALTVNDDSVIRVDWLEKFKNLNSLTLYLSSFKVSDISVLKELKNLNSLTLSLWNSEVSDISVLKDVTAKEIKLDIRESKITKLKGIPPTVTELSVGN